MKTSYASKKINLIIGFILASLLTFLFAFIPPAASAASLPADKFYILDPAGSIQRLVSIDPQTQQVETVLNLTGTTGFRANTITFSPSGELYGWNNTRSQLFKVNTTTGLVTLIGSPTTYYSINGMSFDKDGNLYGLNDATNEVVKINTTTSTVSIVGPLGFELKHHGMGVDFNNNEFYGISGLGADFDYLFKINKQMPDSVFTDNFSTNTTGNYTWASQGIGTSKTWSSAGYVQMDGYSTAWDPAYIDAERTINNLPASGYAKIKFNIIYNGTGQSRMHFFLKQDENNWYRFAATDATLGSSGYTEGVEKKVNGIAETYKDQNTTSIVPGGDGWYGNRPYVMEVWWSPTKIRMAINGWVIREVNTKNVVPIIPTGFKIRSYRFVANIDSVEIYPSWGLGEIIGPLGVSTGGVAVEFSPVDGELYTIRESNKFMKVDLGSGHATPLGTLQSVNTVNLAAQWPRAPLAPVAKLPEALSTASIRWNFEDQADNEQGFMLHDSNDNIKALGASPDLSYLDENGLTANTEYTRHIHAFNLAGNSPKSVNISRYTLAAEPNVSADKEAIIWHEANDITFINNVGFGSGGVEYYRYAFDQNPLHAWTNEEEIWGSGSLDLPVTQDGSWYLHVKSFNGDDVPSGEKDCGPFNFDNSAPTGTVIINNDDLKTNNPEVTLSFTVDDKAGSKVTEMRFSDDKHELPNIAYIPFSNTSSYTLPAANGNKIVYAQFRDAAGNESDVVNDHIVIILNNDTALRPTTLSLSSSSTRSSKKDILTIGGVLKTESEIIKGQNVTIKVRVLKKIKKKVKGKVKIVKKYDWKKIKTAKTDSNGIFKLDIKSGKKTANVYRAFFDGFYNSELKTLYNKSASKIIKN